jgi:hypothetical protein
MNFYLNNNKCFGIICYNIIGLFIFLLYINWRIIAVFLCVLLFIFIIWFLFWLLFVRHMKLYREIMNKK